MMKVLSLILVLAMVMCLSVTAFATGNPSTMTEVPGSGSVGIVAGYEKTTDNVVHKYDVTIGWATSGTLKYTVDKDTYTWNTNTLQYDKELNTNGTWTADNVKVTITITNRSDAAIKVECGDPVEAEGITAITGHYGEGTDTTATLNIASAAPAAYNTGASGTEQSGRATYTITGVDGAITADATTIGTITVAISAPATTPDP